MSFNSPVVFEIKDALDGTVVRGPRSFVEKWSGPKRRRSQHEGVEQEQTITTTNRLVGPGERESKTTTNYLCVVDEVDVTETLMMARQKVVERQSLLKEHDVSDLLCLNFIFDESFLRAQLPEHMDIVSKLFHVDVTEVDGPSLLLLSKFTTNAQKSPTMTSSENEGTYSTEFIVPIIKSTLNIDDLTHHCFPFSEQYTEDLKPDYFGEYRCLPFVVAEIKKPGVINSRTLRDRRKLPYLMKLALDGLLKHHVKDPVVVGFLIQDNQFQVLSMELKYEALYFLKEIDIFYVPEDNKDMWRLMGSLGPLTTVK
ncbi:hypothetical protein BGZ65_009817, partial [Modicella reniformis]